MIRLSAIAPLLALLTLSGCTKGNFSRAAARERRAFTYALDNPVSTMDPGKVQDIDMGDLLRNVFEGLVAYDENNRISPQLASSWKVSKDGRIYTFKIRPDVAFSDGTPLTAEAFKWSWKRNLSPKLQSAVAHDYLNAIVGVDDYIKGKSQEISGVEVVDDHTLRLTLDKPRPYFLGDLTYPCTFAINPTAAGPGEMTKTTEAIGTGPFKLVRALEDQEMDLEANSNYYSGPPLVPAIHRPIIKDPSTRLNKFKGGELDEVSVSREDLKSIQNDASLGKELQLQPRPALFYFHLNEHSYAPFSDVRVRRAFAMALNKPHIVNDLLTGFVLAHGILPPGLVGYRRDYKGVPYNPEEAKKLLATTSYGSGSKLPPVTIAYRDGASDARIAATAAAESLSSNLGVRAQPHGYEWGTLLDLRNKGKLQMVFSSWYADYLDPQNFLSMLLKSHVPQNSEGWSNAKFDELCTKADADLDEASRVKLYQQAEDIAVEQVAKLPLYFQRDAVLISPRVSGIRSNLFGDLPHLKVQLK